MKLERARSAAFGLFAFVSVALAATACAAPSGDDEPTEETSSPLSRGGLGVDGDACTVRTNPDGTKVPGTEKGIDCCSTASPTDCVVILKPFPSASRRLIR